MYAVHNRRDRAVTGAACVLCVLCACCARRSFASVHIVWHSLFYVFVRITLTIVRVRACAAYVYTIELTKYAYREYVYRNYYTICTDTPKASHAHTLLLRLNISSICARRPGGIREYIQYTFVPCNVQPNNYTKRSSVQSNLPDKQMRPIIERNFTSSSQHAAAA